MKYTTNLNLKKPDYTDPADIKDVNDNMDTVDQVITSHMADTMPHTFVDAGTGKIYRYGLSIVDGVVTMNYEEVI